MKNKLEVFQSEEFGRLEIKIIDNKPYFPATECARMLGYSDAVNAIKHHCKLGNPWVVKHHVGYQQELKDDIIIH